MQINGAHLASVFAPKSLELQEPARKPVTIDASSSFKLDDEPNSQAKPESQAVQAAITVNDGQQAKFVRFFAARDEASSSTQQNLPSQTLPLAQGVQQYRQVADLQSEPARTVLDEIV